MHLVFKCGIQIRDVLVGWNSMSIANENKLNILNVIVVSMLNALNASYHVTFPLKNLKP